MTDLEKITAENVQEIILKRVFPNAIVERKKPQPEKFIYTSGWKVSLFQVNDNLERITEEPLLSITQEEIERQHVAELPNMYYPCVSSLEPIEVKAAYFMAKNLVHGKIIPWNIPIEIYNEKKELVGEFNLGPGRGDN